jgi:hypothetical protein
MISLGIESLRTRLAKRLPQTPTKSRKVVESDFTPRTLKVAKRVRAETKDRTILMDAFPVDKEDFVWEAAKKIYADASPEDELAICLERLETDDRIKEMVIKYVSPLLPSLPFLI